MWIKEIRLISREFVRRFGRSNDRDPVREVEDMEVWRRYSNKKFYRVIQRLFFESG
jgi:hypothetical protein